MLLRRLAPRIVMGMIVILAGGRAAQADVMELGAGSWHWVTNSEGVRNDVSAPAAASQAALLAGVPPRWRGQVARLSERYDLSPAIIAALIWQESRWHANAVSPKGARGLAQLMPATARDLGVNPRDPDASIEAGARYLHQLLVAFDGNVEKALAAYNAGPTRVTKAGGIPHIRETRAYVAAIFAHLSGSEH